MTRWLVTFVVLGGCRQIFGIGQPDPASATDAAVDGLEIDVPPTCKQVDVSSSADVSLIATTGNQGHGLEGVMTIGVSLPSEGLFRFAIPPIEPDVHVAAVRLTVPFAMSSMSCGGNCGSCLSIAKPGTFAVEYATSAWDEATACYNRPVTSGAWGITGALGAMDRSGMVGTTTSQQGMGLVVDLDPTQALSWIQDGKLSVIVTPSGMAITLAPQVQYPMVDGTCSATQAPVVLRVTTCP